MATREIVGWAMEGHMRAELCCGALEMALGRRGPVPGLIHHSDRGSQYAGGDYRKLLKKAGLTQSMSRKGECLDNAPMESFFASLKKELVHQVLRHAIDTHQRPPPRSRCGSTKACRSTSSHVGRRHGIPSGSGGR